MGVASVQCDTPYICVKQLFLMDIESHKLTVIYSCKMDVVARNCDVNILQNTNVKRY